MLNIPRPHPFVLLSSNHGTVIVNRNDYHMVGENSGYGVGYQLMNTGSFDQKEIDFALALLSRRRINFGPGVVAIDCGANIGIHTLEWARLMHQWGHVYSFEAQEKIFYAMAGNVIINNCLNVTARHCAVGASCGTIDIPEPNYLVPSSYGSFELKKNEKTEFIGQEIDYKKTKPVPMISLDSLELARLDFIKIDVEGMEVDVLQGAEISISAHKPMMMIEIIKSDREAITAFLQKHDYNCYPMGINLLAVHSTDPLVKNIKHENNTLSISG